MFITKRPNGLSKIVTDEDIHKKAIKKMINTGVYEFELVSDTDNDIVAIAFSVAVNADTLEKETLYKEFYGRYWQFVEEVKKSS